MTYFISSKLIYESHKFSNTQTVLRNKNNISNINYS